jgi:thiol-disulfide isomerase/thioredoxin
LLISNSEIKSAYLNHAKLQPVKWYLWSEEVFELAKKEDKPILVDVGASWCHWCHVMDDESYSNPEIAEIINDNYIPVKIDRDEMPDVDRILQKSCKCDFRRKWMAINRIFNLLMAKCFLVEHIFLLMINMVELVFKKIIT